ncbi:hypothetical protein [Vibrio japonicus]|uniref:Uncharacterized protein n=1 Tax=Vibrio japonicus TaxID=1824638 RepID=A0ABY5LMP0_9VIBR|nr:hypothetical protein [Vibrio japonicus]UUM32058.1 hypothetical protein NP165_17315 [Vibrio japonicus]
MSDKEREQIRSIDQAHQFELIEVFPEAIDQLDNVLPPKHLSMASKLTKALHKLALVLG